MFRQFLFMFVFFLPVLLFADGDPIVKTSPAGTAKRDMIITDAKNYIGTVYSYGGKSRKGFDCSGFVVFIFGQHGIILPRSSSAQYRIGSKISEEGAVQGDLVFFKIDDNRISHVGIYIGNHEFIHSPSTGKKIRIDSLYDTYWRKHLAGFVRYIE